VGGELASWSRNGRLMAAPAWGKIDLVNPDGSVARQLPVRGVRPSTLPCECGLGWSKDGGRVLFSTPGSAKRKAVVGSIDVDGGPPRLKQLRVPVGAAAWSPRGWPLVFVPRSGVFDHDASRGESEPDLRRLDGLRAEPYKILAQQGTEIRPQFSPDGTKILYVRKHEGLRNVWVVNADGSHPRQLTRRLWLSVAAWSPDGRRVAVAGFSDESGSRLYVISVSGRGSERLAGIGNLTNGLAWTPDGRWITYADFDGRIRRVRPDGSHREAIGGIPDREVRRLLWSPDGRHLAYAARNLEDERYD
jgi:Tol biopolymer transport system component